MVVVVGVVVLASTRAVEGKSKEWKTNELVKGHVPRHVVASWVGNSRKIKNIK